MPDRPINLRQHEVRATLAGRQTMLRRVIKPQPFAAGYNDGEIVAHIPHPHEIVRFSASAVGGGAILEERHDLRYAPGDRLWCREIVACGICAPSKSSYWAPAFWRREQGSAKNPNGLWYAADGLSPETTITERGAWHPSSRMPRWASRLTLLVDEVKVERLQDISEEDAWAEGCKRGIPTDNGDFFPAREPDPRGGERGWDCARDWYADLWDATYGHGSWGANPWIVAVRFRPVHANIDSLTAVGA